MVAYATISFPHAAHAQAQAAEVAEAKSAPVLGGRVYRARIDAGGASIALWRYVAAGAPSGAPILIVPELLCARSWYDAFARELQARGRDVFLFEWRGSGESGRPARSFGDLASLFLGDAPAALDAVLAASGARSVELIGHGLGGAAAVLLASSARGARVSSLALFSVPQAYGVPNQALRNFISAVRAQPAAPGFIALGPFASMPAPLGDPERPGEWLAAQGPLDLFALLAAHGTALSATRQDELRAGLGGGMPALFSDLARWMETGELDLIDGPRAPAQRLSAAWAALAQPAFLVVAPEDDLVHPEHALARRGDAPGPRGELFLQRIEGFPEDAGHLALQAPWGPRLLAPRVLEWFEEHP